MIKKDLTMQIKTHVLDAGGNGHPVVIARNSNGIRVFRGNCASQSFESIKVDKSQARELFNQYWFASYADEFLN